MNAPATVHPIRSNAAWLTPERLQQARESALWNQSEGRHGTALMINVLVAEIESLREAAKGSLVIVNQAVTEKNLAVLKASTLLIVAEKIAPVIDSDIVDRKLGGEGEDWTVFQSLSDELHAAMRLARG